MKTLGESLLSANFPFSMVWEEEMERGREGEGGGGGYNKEGGGRKCC